MHEGKDLWDLGKALFFFLLLFDHRPEYRTSATRIIVS